MVLAHHKELARKSLEKNSEYVRTYNEPDNRVKDHKSGLTQEFKYVVDTIDDMLESRLGL